jgi:hypothetical protein
MTKALKRFSAIFFLLGITSLVGSITAGNFSSGSWVLTVLSASALIAINIYERI